MLPHMRNLEWPPPLTPPSQHTHRRNAQEHQSKARNIHHWICMRAGTHTPLTCTRPLSGNSPSLNYMQTYAITDLFWQPIICFLSFASSIFHAHFLPITAESLVSCKADIKICGAEPQWWNEWCNACVGVCVLVRVQLNTQRQMRRFCIPSPPVFVMSHLFMHGGTRGILDYHL